MTPPLLFRYSALTYNGHRIPYDRDYARDVEGYPGPLTHGPLQALAMAEAVRTAGMTAGIAINPPTPVEPLLPLISAFDLVLIMSVNPGFSGQAFIADVLTKTRRIAPLLRPDQRLQMDGGIGSANAPEIRSAGCDVLVAASAIFGSPPQQWASIIRALRG